MRYDLFNGPRVTLSYTEQPRDTGLFADLITKAATHGASKGFGKTSDPKQVFHPATAAFLHNVLAHVDGTIDISSRAIGAEEAIANLGPGEQGAGNRIFTADAFITRARYVYGNLTDARTVFEGKFGGDVAKAVDGTTFIDEVETGPVNRWAPATVVARST